LQYRFLFLKKAVNTINYCTSNWL